MDRDTLFAGTARPNPQLFFRRGDSNDVRLGEIVSADPAAYDRAQVVILGCPQDEGVRRNGGRTGAAAAPDTIRSCLYRLGTAAIDQLRIFDLGNTKIQSTLEDTHVIHRRIVGRIIADGKRLIVLGGGNDISYPDCAGLADTIAPVLAFNIDAHYDVRADDPRNSGTPYRQLLEEGNVRPHLFYEIGSQPFANSAVYDRYLRDKGATIVSAAQLRETGIDTALNTILAADEPEAIFWGFDLDVVRASDAPGVSAPNALGLSGDELCRIAAIAGYDRRTRLVEFTEVNPTYDLDLRTCRLTAVAIYSYLAALATVEETQ